jgi:FkbM family methyltransferase
MALLRHFEINKILDVGANVGDYAIELRKLGFHGKIVSFEPLEAPYQELKKNVTDDNNWDAVNIALGNTDEESFINIAGNCNSSSLLDMLPDHVNSAPQSSYIGKEKIIVRKLDSVMNDYRSKGDNILLKIDTQGFEKQVLDGAEQSLPVIRGIQLEMSLLPLYSGSILYLEMIELLKNKGYKLYSLENGFSNPETGQLLQVDGIFFR